MYNGDSDYLHITQNEGIPNVKGTTTPTIVRWFSNFAGALNFYNRATRNSLATADKTHDVAGIQFDAANGEVKSDGTYKNDVYGKSDHVTTYNSAIQIWRRIS